MDLFDLACQVGDIDTAKILLNDDNLQYINYYNMFRHSCYSGHLEIAKWIYSLIPIDIHSDDEAVFRWTCYHGHFIILK